MYSAWNFGIPCRKVELVESIEKKNGTLNNNAIRFNAENQMDHKHMIFRFRKKSLYLQIFCKKYVN
jgi:hypothetical protein